jgi:transcription elongation factor GreA
MDNNKYNLTQEGLDNLKKRLEELKIEEKENIVALQDARAQGDLSENADYDAARDAQARIAAEIKDVTDKINNAVIITSVDTNNLGKYVTVRFLDDNEEETYLLVGTIEADPLANKISNLSPLGKAILHAKQGSTVRVKTEDEEQFDVLIVKISKK